MKSEFILCAAILYDGHIVSGHRHSDCYDTLKKFNVPEAQWPQRGDLVGFLTSENRYVTRKEAWKIAYDNDQIMFGRDAVDPDQMLLISENLY